MMRAYAPSRRCAPLRRPQAELARVDVRGASPERGRERVREAIRVRSPACAPSGGRTRPVRRSAPRTGGEEVRQPLLEPPRPPARRRGRSSADRGRRRRSVRPRRASRATNASTSSTIQRIGRSDRPDSSALRRAQPTAGRDPSTWVTAAPAAAADERHRAGVREEVQDGRRPRGSAASVSRTQARFGPCSGKQPDLAGVGRSQLEPAGRRPRPSNAAGTEPPRADQPW